MKGKLLVRIYFNLPKNICCLCVENIETDEENARNLLSNKVTGVQIQETSYGLIRE